MREEKTKVFKGVYTALVSPFTQDGKLDTAAFSKLLDRQANAGVAGFVPCGTTGENPTLTNSEWRKLIQLSVETAKKRKLQVIAGCGSNNTAEAIKLISEAFELGSDAALVVTPYYNKPTQSGLIAHYEAIAAKSPLPIFLYNVPGRTNVHLSFETVAHLFKNEKIIGIKEASGNHSHWIRLASELDIKNKALFAGDDDAFATLLALGGSGIISASANVAPERFVKIFNAALANDWVSAFATQKQLVPLIQSLFMETSPAPTKFALSALGQIENTLRLPLVKGSPTCEQTVRECLTQIGLV